MLTKPEAIEAANHLAGVLERAQAEWTAALLGLNADVRRIEDALGVDAKPMLDVAGMALAIRNRAKTLRAAAAVAAA